MTWDFAEANPIGMGINFTCTMDVAIRALNWAIGLELGHGCAAIDRAWWQRVDQACAREQQLLLIRRRARDLVP